MIRMMPNRDREIKRLKNERQELLLMLFCAATFEGDFPNRKHKIMREELRLIEWLIERQGR